MIVRWSADARADRREIRDYIAAESPLAAARMDAIFNAAAAGLSEFPQRGRSGAISGTRELIPHPSYRLVYEIDDGTVMILALVHAARLWPPDDPA